MIFSLLIAAANISATGAATAAELIADATAEDYRLVGLDSLKRGRAVVAIDQQHGPPRCHATGVDTSINEASCALVLAKLSWMTKLRDDQGKPPRIPLVTVRWQPAENDRNAPESDDSQLGFGGATPIGRDTWFATFPLGDAEKSGAIIAAFEIGWSGNITECRVERPSGDAGLDRHVCQLLVERARFLPALDDKGLPRDTRGKMRVRWLPNN